MSGVSWCRTARRCPALLSLGVLLLALLPVPVATAQTDTAFPNPCDGSTSADYNGGCGPSFTLPRWSDASQWNQPQYYETILLADFDGDGADELLARSSSGFIINRWDAQYGQWVEQGAQSFPSGNDFSDAAGWNQPQYYATIQAAYLGYNGGSAASLLMNGPNGIIAFQWDGQQTWTALPAGPAWGASWNAPAYYATIQTWGNWLIGRAASGLQTWQFSGGAWQQLAGQQSDNIFSDAGDWNLPQYYPTIKLVDLDGDGTPELVGRGVTGMYVYTWSGSNWANVTAAGPFPDSDGWDEPQYYETILYADIDGAAGDEMLARGAAGVQALSWNGSGWDSLPVNTVVFPDSGGWDLPQYYQTMQVYTLTSGQPVLTARGSGGPIGYVYDPSTGDFNTLYTGPELADGPNPIFPLWAQPAYYDTIHYADVSGDGTAELVARGQYGVRSWAWGGSSAGWQRPLPYGFQSYSDSAEQNAFGLVNMFLNIDQGQTIRDWYTSLDSQVGQNYQDCLSYSLSDGQPQPPTQTCYLTPPDESLSNPNNVTATDWSNMVTTLQAEIAQAGDVDGFFNESMSGVLNALFAGDDNSLTSIADQLEIEEKANDEKATSSWFTLFIGMAEALVNLASPGWQAVIDGFGAAFGALNNVSSPTTSGFEGELSDAQADLTNYNNQAIDQNNAFFQYVAQDYGLLYAVGEMVSDQTWLITADVQNDMVSVGRRHFAVWTYQLLLPTIWAISQYSCETGPGGDCPDFPAAYVYDASAGSAWARELYDIESQATLDPAPPAFDMLLNAIQDGCYLGPDGQGVWSYGACNLGVPKSEVFLLQDGWNFTCTSGIGPNCSAKTVAMAAAHRAAGDDGTAAAVSPGSSDVFHAAVLSSPNFDARTLDPTTVTLAGAPVIGWWVGSSDLNPDGTLNWPDGTLADVNGDGLLDVLLNFHMQAMQLTAGDTLAYLEGLTITGDDVLGVLRVSVIS